MSDETEVPGARQPKSGPDRYVGDLQRQAVPPAVKAIRTLFPPGSSHALMQSFFQHRVTMDAIKKWRAGKRNPPQWALDLLARHGDELAACARQAKAGNHTEAGQRALDLYRRKRRALSP